MKKAFTLIELLVVVAIMGLMGTMSIGGYRQLQRGMEERGVMQNVNQFIRNAYQRAQIDRQPVEVYFWNETIREATADESEIVVGRAVAVRRAGRITQVSSSASGGSLLIDEFGDMEQFDEEGNYSEKPRNDTNIKLYQVDAKDSNARFSLVQSIPQTRTGSANGGVQLDFVTHDPITDTNDSTSNKGKLILYGYVETSNNGASWKVGTPYGFEFQTIELPHGYLFGQSYSQDINSPKQGEQKLYYLPDTSPSGGIVIYALRPNTGGTLAPQRIAAADNPTKKL